MIRSLMAGDSVAETGASLMDFLNLNPEPEMALDEVLITLHAQENNYEFA
ncbi:MAG: hypothetical protein WCL16_09375 [bacterium]